MSNSHVEGRVHGAVQDALDPNFIIREGVEDDVLADESRPIARSHGVPLLSVFWLCAALLKSNVEVVEIAVGLRLAELVVTPSARSLAGRPQRDC